VGDRDIVAGRDTFLELRAAARAGDWSRFDRERERLGTYPLASYADYDRLMTRLRHTPGDEARAFVDAHRDSPLGVRYLGHYLARAGRDRRWGDFLQAATQEPRSEKLRCYYARAKRGRGQETEAWDLAARLFLASSSVDEACDPLFRLWKEAGGPDDSLIWRRATLAFAAREAGLLRYVASLGGPREALDVLLRVYREPQRTLRLSESVESPYREEIITLGLERYSRYDPARALKQLLALDLAVLDSKQRRRVEEAIALRGLIEHDGAVRAWADGELERWGDDRLTAIRLRWAIAEQDWSSIHRHLGALGEQAANEDVWRYWRGRSLEALGKREAAEETLRSLARERSYYGFLAADHIDQEYAFQAASPRPLRPELTDSLPPVSREAAWRVHELNAIEESRLAHAEWTHLLPRVDTNSRLLLAQVAEQQGWYRLAIDAANAGNAWDHLELRFPLAYTSAFETRASVRGVRTSELMAIARRESAFFPTARSPVGARGLMQLMPSTGIAVARDVGLKLDVSQLYEVDHNLDLGSAYYRQLLDRFDGNRAVALAAYNAGPNRVQHWVDSGLPVDAWIESIPYRETRDYVKAVLAYSVVFDHRMGRDARLFTPGERRGQY
jgi:soluble lytic murein transglycosylase